MLFVEKILKGCVWIYGLIMILILFTPAVLNLHMYAYMYPYFVAGFVFNKFNGTSISQRIIKKDWYALAVDIIIFAILFLFYERDSYIYTTGINILGENGVLVQLRIDVYRWIIGFVGATAVILFCMMLCKKYQGVGVKLFAYFGQISLGIYIINQYTNGILCRIAIMFSPNVSIWFAETAISMGVYIVVVEILKRIPTTKKLLLGGR